MNEEERFRAMFTDADGADLAKAFAAVDAEDPEAALRRNASELATDPTLAWRQAVSAACVEEGVSYQWLVPEGRTVVFLPGAHPVSVPDGYLTALQGQGSHPWAVACLLKAVSIDPRFRGWRDEEDEE